jgi:uncharacterized protein (DUF433 family)
MDIIAPRPMPTACSGNNPNPRCVLTLLESVVIADISEERVRKDIELKRVIPAKLSADGCSRWYFSWGQVATLALIYRSATAIPASWRKGMWETCERDWKDSVRFVCVKNHARDWDSVWGAYADAMSRVAVAENVYLDGTKVLGEIAPRFRSYARGLSRIEERAELNGGGGVFKGTRLSVAHIGEIYAGGESIEHILEDFAGIDAEDVDFAKLYYEAHPPVGRPRKKAGPGRDDSKASA